MILFIFIQIVLILLDRYFFISTNFVKIEKVEGEERLEESQYSLKNVVKLLMHWMLLIVVHVVMIWYFPITGNLMINEKIYCRPDDPCNDFETNSYLIFFYLVYLTYFFLNGY